jgi:hypothetical protein
MSDQRPVTGTAAVEPLGVRPQRLRDEPIEDVGTYRCPRLEVPIGSS